jgi:hypothetical protein
MSNLRFVRGLDVSDHAVERYIERVRPHLTMQRGRFELERLVRNEGVILDAPPAWVHESDDVDRRADAWVEIGSTGLVCPVYRRIVLTIMHPGGMSTTVRERRNERKRKKKAIQRERRAVESWIGSSQPRWK